MLRFRTIAGGTEMSAPLDQPMTLSEMQPRTIVIGTAGHIDHGKTALIRALTGIDTDRLPEEKKRGITIDLGFASLEMSVAGGTAVRISFIDVPGHARFVRNMLAGAGGIDAVLLLISAEEGVKPQTREHLAICSLLGIERGITVLTKIDAVDEARLDEVRAQAGKFLSGTFLEAEPAVETSAAKGIGLDALRREVRLLFERVQQRQEEFVTRLPVDRVFTMKGFGTVVTGTLIAGSITTGGELAVEPGDKATKIRGLQVHGRAAEKAMAPTRVALNLSNMEVTGLQRGDTLVEHGTVRAVDVIDVEIELLPDSEALKHRTRMHFHAFASECMATVSVFGYQAIETGAKGVARLRLAHPVVLLPGDRFVLRRGSPLTTVGGGIVMDAHPLERAKRAEAEKWLRQFLRAGGEERISLRVARRDADGIRLRELVTETGMRPDPLRTKLEAKIQAGAIVALDGQIFVERGSLQKAAALTERELGRLLREAGSGGVKRSALKSRLRLRAEVVDWAIEDLEKRALIRTVGEEIHAPAAGGTSTGGEREPIDLIEGAYRKAGLTPPLPSVLAAELGIDPNEMRRRITVLLREKRIVRLGNDALCIHQEALAGLKEKMRPLRGQWLDVAQFKELAGLTRKYAIPLLEYLDRERVTRQEGDRRVVL